jgi:CheY-like chemotaxis protein
MSEELLSLRMLLVGASKGESALWAQGTGRASVPIEFYTHDPETSSMPKGGVDIFVVDASLSTLAMSAIVQAARSLRPVPLVVVCGAPHSNRPPGVDGIIPRPAVVDDARRLTDLCIRAALPNRVLIVDDSSTMRSIVRKILSASRFRLEVEETSDGPSAVEQVRSGRFGIVFVDYNMPGFNGLDTLKEIRRQHEEVAVVMITSSLDSALQDRAIAAGAFAFLKKPFYPADIDAILERYYRLNG